MHVPTPENAKVLESVYKVVLVLFKLYAPKTLKNTLL